MSNFPSQIDTDADLPIVTNNVTEIGAEAINAIRSAIFAIENTLGSEVNGSSTNLKNRLDAVLNPDGTFKSAALVAAGLIALPITDSMVATNAAILESKLDLDHTTQSLYNLILSNDVDIATLQAQANVVLANFLAHVSGALFKHDGYQILLETAYPSSPPPNIYPLNSTSVGEAIYSLKDAFFQHISATKVNAHTAENISLDISGLSRITSDNLQGAVEELEGINETLFIDHRDDLHASGFSNFANSRDGYSTSRQILPEVYASTVTAYVLPDRQTIQFDGYNLSTLGISAGDVVRVSSPLSAIGSYTIEAIGIRSAIGAKPALTAYQAAISENIPYDGYVSAAVFSPSSTSTLKGNMAPTIHQSDIRVDSVQVARPNAAKILTLGINPRFINSAHTIEIEAGVGSGLSRSIAVSNLNLNRNSVPQVPVTIDSVVERLNHVFQNRADGYAFPVAAYKVGDELMLSHNWCESDDYYLKVTSSGSTAAGLYVLGLDEYGANVVDVRFNPTHTASFYINGKKLSDVAAILNTTANVTSQTFTFPGGENPEDLGIKVGHLLHLKSHTNPDELGTYFITGVDASSVTVHKNAGITTENGIDISIAHDAIPLDEVQGYVNHATIETYYDSFGRGGYHLRTSNDLVTNVTNSLRVIDVSDNMLPGTSSIGVSVSGGGSRISFSNGVYKEVPPDFNGILQIRDDSNSATASLAINGPIIGTGTVTLSVFAHSLEEEVLELCSVWFDGATTLQYITDRRLFGTTGLDEIREDVVRAYSELPQRELRADGIIVGFDVITENYTDAESITGLGSNIYGVLFRGGVCYVDGVRSDVASKPIFFPYAAANYVVYANNLGNLQYIQTGTGVSDGYLSVSEIIDGYNGHIAPIAIVSHSGTGSTPISTTDLRYFINEIDYKLDLVLDTTNRRIGNFATYEAAEEYIDNCPYDDNLTLKVVSNDSTYPITTSVGSKHFSLVISGKIGHLTVNSGLKVESESTMSASSAQIAQLTINDDSGILLMSDVAISGAVTATITDTDSIIVFKNVKFSGAVTISTAGQIVFDGCTFSSTCSFDLVAANSQINGSRIFTTSFEIESYGSSIISESTFKTTGSFGTLSKTTGMTAGHIISGCFFDGTLGGTTLNISCSSKISGCTFYAIEISTGSIISVTGTADVDVVAEGCIFNEVVTDTNGQIGSCTSSARLELSNSCFNSCTFNNTYSITVSKFVGNTVNTASGIGFSVNIAGTGYVLNNNGISSVTLAAVSATDVVREISGNTFISDSAYNISINKNGFDTSQTVIKSNLLLGSIKLISNGTDVTITDNLLNGATGIVFDSLNTQTANIIVSNNVFKTQTYMTFTDDVGQLIIENNIFDNTATSNTTMRLGSYSSVINNLFLDTNTEIRFSASSSRSVVRIEGNDFKYITRLQSSLTLSKISGNVFASTFMIDTSVLLTNCIISDNRIDTLDFGTGNVFTGINFNSNQLNGWTSGTNCTWQDSTISDNRIRGTSAGTVAAVINMHASGGNTISSNVMESPITLTSATSVKRISFVGNRALQKTLTVAINLEESEISHNSGFDIQVTGGLDNSTISFNETASSAIDTLISGQMSNSQIFGNNTLGLNVQPLTGSFNVAVDSNTVQSSLTIFGSDNSTYELLIGSVSDNIISDNLVFDSNSGAGADRVASDIRVNGNKAENLIFLTGTTSATQTVSKVSVANNSIRGALTFGTPGVGTLTDCEIANNSIDKVSLSASSIDVFKITNNNIRDTGATGTSLDITTTATGQSVTYLAVKNNYLAKDCNVALGAGSAYRMVFSGNSLGSGAISFSSTRATFGIGYAVFSDNVGHQTSLDLSGITSASKLDHVIITNNTLADIVLPTKVSTSKVIGNTASSIDMSASGTTASAIVNLLISDNDVAGDFMLPGANNVFLSGSSQSKIINNYAGTWSSTGTISTAGNTNLFVWGNTSASAGTGSVTFGGTTATNVATGNNITGGGITC